jgi:NitT/TauT family transport system substrate-binding protein
MRRAHKRATGNKNVKLTSIVLALLAVVLFASLSGCAEKESAGLIHLKVVDLAYIPFTTFYIAQEEGFFAEQGLEVEFVKFNSVTDALPLLIQGDLDVAAGSISAALFNAIAQNMNIKIVAGRDYIDPDQGNMALVVRKDLYDSGELNTVAAVKGKQVAMGCTACIYDFALTKILENAGLTLGDVAVARMAPQVIIAAFTDNALDLATVGSLQIGQLTSLGCVEILEPFNNVIPGFQVSYIMFGPTLINDNPDVGNKFMIAYLKGARQYLQGKTERNLEIAEKYTDMDRETLLQSPWAPLYADGRVNTDDVSAFQDWAYEQDLVDKEVSVEQIIDTSFIDYANDVLGTAPTGE